MDRVGEGRLAEGGSRCDRGCSPAGGDAGGPKGIDEQFAYGLRKQFAEPLGGEARGEMRFVPGFFLLGHGLAGVASLDADFAADAEGLGFNVGAHFLNRAEDALHHDFTGLGEPGLDLLVLWELTADFVEQRDNGCRFVLVTPRLKPHSEDVFDLGAMAVRRVVRI